MDLFGQNTLKDSLRQQEYSRLCQREKPGERRHRQACEIARSHTMEYQHFYEQKGALNTGKCIAGGNEDR